MNHHAFLTADRLRPAAGLVLRFVCFLAVLGMTARATRAQSPGEGRLIVTSTTQVADFARQIVGDRWQVRSVLAPGQDPHMYEIKPGDARLVSQADLCLDNGWHLEGKDWMRTLAENAGKPIVTCIEGSTPLELEAEGEKFYDPHAWFSPRNAAVYVRNIRDAVVRMDPEYESEYNARTELYLSQLRTLHAWIERQVNAIPPEQRVLVTSHDAFNYFCREYGFESAAPAGWSTRDEIGGGATAERRREAVDSIRRFGVKAIFIETSVNPELIQEIAADAGVTIGGRLYSDSMGPAGTAGETYIGMMRENVLTLVEALQ